MTALALLLLSPGLGREPASQPSGLLLLRDPLSLRRAAERLFEELRAALDTAREIREGRQTVEAVARYFPERMAAVQDLLAELTKEDEAAVLRRIFAWRQEGRSYQRIRDRLNAEGMAASRGPRRRNSTLHTLLGEDYILTYARYRVWNKHYPKGPTRQGESAGGSTCAPKRGTRGAARPFGWTRSAWKRPCWTICADTT